MTTFPTTVEILDVFVLPHAVNCKGPHMKGEDWPPRFTDKSVVGYFEVPIHGGKPLRVHFEIPLCSQCMAAVVD
jgi:hypothetical protein